MKLVLNESDKKNYAIKIANKRKLKRKMLGRTTSVYSLLEKEVATMKKLVFFSLKSKIFVQFFFYLANFFYL